MSTRLLSVLAALVFVAACNSGGQPADGGENEGFQRGSGDGSAEAAPEAEGPAPALVRIQQRGVRIAPGREPTQLTAEVLDANREPVEVRVEWHSLDPEKIEVDALGRLTALGPLGPAFVTASAGEIIAEPLPVYVVDPAELPDPNAEEEEEAEGSAETTTVRIDATHGRDDDKQ